jgi:molybdenum cofactor cytidylyltransferase
VSSREQIAAVVLAAGKSTRMGEPKQLLLLNNRPVLEHTLRNLRAAKVTEIVLVLGFASEAIRHQLALNEVKVVENENYEEGMGESLRAGLSVLSESVDAALVVLADQPFVRSQTYDQIIDRYQRSVAQIVVPTYRAFRGNPVLLDRSVFPEVMALRGEIGCRAIFGDHSDGIARVAVDDIGILLDIDSKEDFKRLQSYAEERKERDALIDAVDLHGRTLPAIESASGERDNLIIVGTEPVAVAIARMGRLLRFRVTVVDPLLQASDLPEADEVVNSLDLSHLSAAPRRCLVIASRGRFDEEAVEQAYAANIGYVALVANPKRVEEVRRRLQGNGYPPDKLGTLRAPAGLNIGASTPEEIALSILAEIVSLKRRKCENVTDTNQ